MEGRYEVVLARWLRQHHGVITVGEATTLGISYPALRGLVADGRVRRVHRGVYEETPGRTTPALTAGAAALAAAGPVAALSHRTAAWVWGLLPQPPTKVDLLVPEGARSRLVGATVHRTPLPFVVQTRQGLRVTEPVRTLLDLAAVAPGQLAPALDQALADRLVHIDRLEAATRPVSGHRKRGVAVVRNHLREQGHVDVPAPSVLESLMMRKVFHRYGLPLPKCEVTVGRFGEYRLDFAYPVILLTVEVDGYVWHSSAEHMAADNARRNRLRTLGWRVLVYTWADVTRRPDETAAEILENYRQLVA